MCTFVDACAHLCTCFCRCVRLRMCVCACAYCECVYASVCARGKLKVCTVTTQVQASEGVQEEDRPGRCSSGWQAPLNLW